MIARIAGVVIVAALAAGTLAFGAVYPWAFVPLALVALGAVGLCWFAGRRTSETYVGLLLAIALVLAAMGLQLLPLNEATLARLSPAAPPALRQLDPVFALTREPHPLSINPAASRHALLLGGAFLLLIPAAARIFSVLGTRWFTYSVASIGTLIAVIGIVVRASGISGDMRVYGFWKPQLNYAVPFGPFVNPNHFAGWMLMALPLTLAWIVASVTAPRPAAGWRDRMLWIASPEGARTLLMLLGAVLMSVAMIMTGSRAALIALVVAVLALSVAAVRGGGSWRARAAALLPALIVVGIAAWTASAAIVEQLNDHDSPVQVRLDAWKDARDIAAKFPLTGSGLNTYSTATVLFQRRNLSQHFAHAHNDYLQLIAEGGLLVGIPVLVLAAVFLVIVAKRFRAFPARDWSWWARMGAVTGMAAVGLQEVGEFSLQIPANAYLFALLAALALHVPRARGAVRAQQLR